MIIYYKGDEIREGGTIFYLLALFLPLFFVSHYSHS